MTLNNIEDVSDALNEKAKNEGFFNQPPADIDHKANQFIADFAAEHRMEAHTVSPSSWWFESKEHGMFEDGEIELQPMIKHAVEELHPGDKNKDIRFVAINIESTHPAHDIND